MNLWFMAVMTDSIADTWGDDPVIFVIGLIVSVIAYFWYRWTHPDRPGG